MIYFLMQGLTYSLDVLVKIYGFILDYLFYIIAGVALVTFVKNAITDFYTLRNTIFNTDRYRQIRPEMKCSHDDLGACVIYQDLKLLRGKEILVGCLPKDENGERVKFDTILLDRTGIHLIEILDYVSYNRFNGRLSDENWLRDCEGESWYIPNPAKRIKEKEEAFKRMFPEYAGKKIYTHVILAENCNHEGAKDVDGQFVYLYTQTYHFFRDIYKNMPKCMNKKEIWELKRKLKRASKIKKPEYQAYFDQARPYYQDYYSSPSREQLLPIL